MRTTTLLLSALLVGATLLSLAPTGAAAGTCTSLLDDCDYLVCYGYSSDGRCSIGVPDDWSCPGPFCEPAAPTGVCVSAAKMDCGGWIVCASYNDASNTCKVGVHKSWLYCPGPLCPDPW